MPNLSLTRLAHNRHPFAWPRLLHWLAVRRSRRALARLGPHMLRDIGLTADAAAREAARPFWDAPERWRS